jgi:hypothetical protein
MVMTIVMVAPDASQVDQAHALRTLHAPNRDGLCTCCLEDYARLAWSPCPQSAWAMRVLAAEEATR